MKKFRQTKNIVINWALLLSLPVWAAPFVWVVFVKGLIEGECRSIATGKESLLEGLL